MIASRRARILVVEDDPAIRHGLVTVLRSAGHETIECDRAEGVVERIRPEPPELALLDVLLPGRDGLALLAELREALPRLPVIMLTARGSEDDRVRGLELGADDYVVKPYGAREVLARVDAVLRRSAERPLPVRRITAGTRQADLERREVVAADGSVRPLSERDAELLRFLAERRGRAVSRTELVSQLWACDGTRVETRSVDMAIARLREKLEDDPRAPRFVMTVRARGYMLDRAARTEP